MPYSDEKIGIYKIVNTVKGDCYVGQSRRVKKRLSDHFNLLRRGKHPNPKLQNAFNKYGEGSFEASIEVVCQTDEDLDVLELAFLSGDAFFDEPVVYNIAYDSPKGMQGRNHSELTKLKISNSKKNNIQHVTSEYRKKLSEGQRKRFFADKKFVAQLRFILDNDHLSYAERARQLGSDTSSVRKKYLTYKHLRGLI